MESNYYIFKVFPNGVVVWQETNDYSLVVWHMRNTDAIYWSIHNSNCVMIAEKKDKS